MVVVVGRDERPRKEERGRASHQPPAPSFPFWKARLILAQPSFLPSSSNLPFLIALPTNHIPPFTPHRALVPDKNITHSRLKASSNDCPSRAQVRRNANDVVRGTPPDQQLGYYIVLEVRCTCQPLYSIRPNTRRSQGGVRMFYLGLISHACHDSGRTGPGH